MSRFLLRRRLSHSLVLAMALGLLVALCRSVPAHAFVVETRELAPGSRYQTTMYVIRGSAPGPVFMITGGVHGSEIAGWMAARRFINREIHAGTFIVIPEANRPAVEERARIPSGGYDLNRVFPTSPGTEPTRLLAREIWEVFRTYGVQWYVDLHEALDFYLNPAVDSVGQTLIHYPRTEATRLGQLAVNELNRGITTSLHKFTLLRYPVAGSIARATAQYLGVNSYIFETSRKLPLDTRIRYQVQLVEIFLRELGLTAPGTPPPPEGPPGNDIPPGAGEDDDPGPEPLEPGLNILPVLAETPDETVLYAWDSGNEGPVVLVVGGLRGDEPGAVAAARLAAELEVTAGKLLVLPEANARALAAGQREAPGEGDLNRAFPRAAGQQPTGALATALWQLLTTYRVDHLVTFVEGTDYYLARTGQYGQTVIYFPVAGAEELAAGMASDVNLAVKRNLATFTVLRNPVPGSLARAAGEVLGIRAYLVELCAREPLEERAEHGARVVDALLARLGMKERSYLPPEPPDPGPGVVRRVLLPGSAHATSLYVQESGLPGPTVMVVGGLRGTETGAVLAAEGARDLHVDRGRLLVLPQAHRLAIELGQASPGGVDLNRQFPRSAGEAPGDELASAIWQVVREYAVDYMVTFTEDTDYYLAGTGKFGHTLIHVDRPGLAELASGVAADLNRLDLAAVARFSTLRNPVPGSLARASGDLLGTRAILVDLCAREPVAKRVELGMRVVDALLARLGLRERAFPLPARETRTPYPGATLHIYHGPRPGPTVLVVGGLRGDEPGAVEAARRVAGLEVGAGRLLVLAEANPAALAAGTRTAGGAGDLNRAFPRAAGESPTDAVAGAIWNLVRTEGVQYLVSFVEGDDYYLAGTGQFGQTVIHFPVAGSQDLAAAMADGVNRVLERALARFTVLRNPVRGSLARAAGEVLGLPAFLVELCRRETLAERAEQGWRAVAALLETLGMAHGICPPPVPPVLPEGVSREVLAAGTKDATFMYRIASGRPGPVLMVVGGLRGDERWSAPAVRSLIDELRPTRGTLLLIPEAARLAVELGTRTAPGEGDLNRAFPQIAGQAPEGPLATAIWQAVTGNGVTHLITLLEGKDYYLARTGEYGQTVIYYPNPGTAELAARVVGALNAGPVTVLARWTALRNPVKGSLARATGEILKVHAFLVEVSARESLAARNEWARRAVLALAAAIGQRED